MWGIPVDTWTLRDLWTLLYKLVSERALTSLSELISLGSPKTQNHSSRSFLMVSSPVTCSEKVSGFLSLVLVPCICCGTPLLIFDNSK